jgi:CBS-domain-containing membrane protein
VGWFVLSAAEQERLAVKAEVLSGMTTTDVMHPVTVVAGWSTVGQFLQRAMLNQLDQPLIALVDLEGRYLGATTVGAIGRLDPAHRAMTRMDQLLRARAVVSAETTPLPELVAALAHRGATAVVLDATSRPVGVVTQADLSRRIGHVRTT